MFAVIYRGYIKNGRESEYQIAWHKVANYFINKRGALGSCLHKTADNLWIAYSRWPDKATRDASWPGEDNPSDSLPDEIKIAVVTLQECIDTSTKFPEICLEVVDDLLLRNS